jgi:hypothetical protein
VSQLRRTCEQKLVSRDLNAWEVEHADLNETAQQGVGAGCSARHVVAPLIMRGAEVDWDNMDLVDVEAVLRCILGLLDADA